MKNIVRRGFSELVDPGPDAAEKAQIWAFFQSECAFCGRALKKGAKEGHIDHLLSASGGGANHLGNRLLACAPCNEKEKRESHWDTFLSLKCESPQRFQSRHRRIKDWIALHADADSCAADLQQPALAAADEVNAFLDQKPVEIRNLLKAGRSLGTV
ncbi:MAG TPA: HNH endonuclease [Gemmatimonadaceae bacterium]|nr:HNH endonuclease [Gemmatimonadaceae bacterium]